VAYTWTVCITGVETDR